MCSPIATVIHSLLRATLVRPVVICVVNCLHLFNRLLDTFELPDGRQVLIYLMQVRATSIDGIVLVVILQSMCALQLNHRHPDCVRMDASQGTLWQIGTFNAKTGKFTSTASTATATAAGHEQGLGSCGQSLTDAKGRRVQFGWQHISLGVTSGAQSLPRVITAATEAQGGGLRFSPLPELETLHNDSTLVSLNFTAASSPGFKMLDPIDQHVRPPRLLAR